MLKHLSCLSVTCQIKAMQCVSTDFENFFPTTLPDIPCFYRMDAFAIPLTCLTISLPFPFLLSFLPTLLRMWNVSSVISVKSSKYFNKQGKHPHPPWSLSWFSQTKVLAPFLSHTHINYTSLTALPLEQSYQTHPSAPWKAFWV